MKQIDLVPGDVVWLQPWVAGCRAFLWRHPDRDYHNIGHAFVSVGDGYLEARVSGAGTERFEFGQRDAAQAWAEARVESHFQRRKST